MEETEAKTQPPSSIHARKSTDSSSSPEFEFWMVRNPSFPQPNILSADQLFVNGVLLPLHLLPQQTEPEPEPEPEPIPEPKPEPETLPESTVGSSASKRWKDIFKIGDRRASTASSSSGNEETTAAAEDKDKEKRKKEKKSSGVGSSGVGISNPTADLNINIWPFSRSRSAGNWSSSGRAKASAAGARKASSAPCSRSNSGGESKSKKWPSSPGRAGVHLGRSSPVWQVRRGGSGGKGSEPLVRRSEKGVSPGNRRSGGGDRSNGGARVLNLSVPLCIGYRQHLSCSSDDNGFGPFGNPSNHSGNGNPGNPSSGNATFFNLRTLFSKKVH